MGQVDPNYDLTQTQPPATPEAQTAQQTDWRALFNQLVPQSTQPTGIVSPESAAALGPQSVPWLGLSSAMKGFEQGFNENRAQMQAQQAQTQAAAVKEQENRNKVIDTVTSKIKSDTNYQDEVTRADAISQAKDLLKNGTAYGDKFMDAFKPTFMQIIRPEFKRITGTEPEGVGSVNDIFRILTSNGLIKATNTDSESWQQFLKGGILTPDIAKDFNALIKDFEARNKTNYTRYAQPYVNMFKDMGAEDLTANYLQAPEGYDVKAAKIGDKKLNSLQQEVVYAEGPEGKGWYLPEELGAK